MDDDRSAFEEEQVFRDNEADALPETHFGSFERTRKEIASGGFLDQRLDLSRYDGHTPEPWAVGETRTNRGSFRSWHETLVHVSSPRAKGRPDGNCIAIVSLGGPGAISYQREDVEANARLIADAPALLAEVKQLREQIEDQAAEIETLQGHLQGACSETKGAEEAWRLAETERDALAEALQGAADELVRLRRQHYGDAGEMPEIKAALARAGRAT